MFNSLAGVKIERVPYKASPQALGDVVSGQVQVMFPDLPQALTQIAGRQGARARRHRPQRTTVAPDLPAIAETVQGLFAGLLAGGVRAGRDAQADPEKLFDAIAEAMKDPATVQAMTQGRMESAVLGLDDFATYVKTETKWWTDAIKAAGIEPE
jgi:tripartite-type tricarboxylate transporter receptor subunit TctC